MQRRRPWIPDPSRRRPVRVLRERTTRHCECAGERQKQDFSLITTPVALPQSPGQRYFTRAMTLRTPAAIRMTTTIVGLPVTPLSRACYSSRPEALRPRLAAGLPLRCEASKPD
jgi:hypothetical protein